MRMKVKMSPKKGFYRVVQLAVDRYGKTQEFIRDFDAERFTYWIDVSRGYGTETHQVLVMSEVFGIPKNATTHEQHCFSAPFSVSFFPEVE